MEVRIGGEGSVSFRGEERKRKGDGMPKEGGPVVMTECGGVREREEERKGRKEEEEEGRSSKRGERGECV